MTRRTLILAAIGACILAALAYWRIGLSATGSPGTNGAWHTLAVLVRPGEGQFFVREETTSALSLPDVGFGYIDVQGRRYSYPLEHDALPWRGVRLVETNGVVTVLRGARPAATFDPSTLTLHNLILSTTYGQTTGVSHGYPQTFFNLSSSTEAVP